MKHYTLYFAQAYGEGSYGEGQYSCTVQQQADGLCETVQSGGGTSGGNGNNGGLADTGIAVLAVVTLACLILFVTFAVRILRRKPTPVFQEAESPSDDPLNRSL